MSLFSVDEFGPELHSAVAPFPSIYPRSVTPRIALAAVAIATLFGVVACGGSKRTSPTSTGTSFTSHCDNCRPIVHVLNGPPTVVATLRTFVGYWWGHGRGLRIDRFGRGREFERATLDTPPFNASLRFRIVVVGGSRTAADARFRVLSVRNVNHTFPRIRIGQLGTLRLRHGVVTDGLTHGTYCAPHVDRCGL